MIKKREREREMHRRACVYVRIHTYTKATNALNVRPPSNRIEIYIYNIYIKQIYIKNTHICI